MREARLGGIEHREIEARTRGHPQERGLELPARGEAFTHA